MLFYSLRWFKLLGLKRNLPTGWNNKIILQPIFESLNDLINKNIKPGFSIPFYTFA